MRYFQRFLVSLTDILAEILGKILAEILKSNSAENIELLNNKLHVLLPPGGLVSLPGGFASLSFDKGVP